MQDTKNCVHRIASTSTYVSRCCMYIYLPLYRFPVFKFARGLLICGCFDRKFSMRFMRRHAFNLTLPPSQHGPMLSKPFGQVTFLVFEAIIQRGAARAVSNIDVDAVQLHQQLGHFVQPILCRHMQQIVSVVVLQRGEGSGDESSEASRINRGGTLRRCDGPQPSP